MKGLGQELLNWVLLPGCWRQFSCHSSHHSSSFRTPSSPRGRPCVQWELSHEEDRDQETDGIIMKEKAWIWSPTTYWSLPLFFLKEHLSFECMHTCVHLSAHYGVCCRGGQRIACKRSFSLPLCGFWAHTQGSGLGSKCLLPVEPSHDVFLLCNYRLVPSGSRGQ